jgi:hypothetical protein
MFKRVLKLSDDTVNVAFGCEVANMQARVPNRSSNMRFNHIYQPLINLRRTGSGLALAQTYSRGLPSTQLRTRLELLSRLSSGRCDGPRYDGRLLSRGGAARGRAARA